MKTLIAAAVVALSVFPARDAGAQAYPAKPIRLIVPFAPGGPNDVIGRVVAQKVSELIGQPIVIENRAGAGGAVGTAAVGTAAPDGYTLLISGTSSLAINPSLYKKLPYDPIKDFAPVSLVGTAPSLLAMHPSVPVRSVKDLIALARSRPGQINYASGGIGSAPHLATDAASSTPEELAAYHRSEITKWANVVRTAGIKPE
ncbi:MAG: hypothetical protein HYY78_05500 [Betaproteobacteria bacterium]|nr:hypothetical protein [Betaproteobacteria bacterium]